MALAGCRQRPQVELRWSFHSERREISEPLKVAGIFQEKLSGETAAPLAFVSPKDVETARQILGRLAFVDAPTFVDYALAEAKKTNFDVKSLGEHRQHVAGFIKSRAHRAATKVATTALAARQQHEADQRA